MLTAKTAAALITELDNLVGWTQVHWELLCCLDCQYSWLLDAVLGGFQGSAKQSHDWPDLALVMDLLWAEGWAGALWGSSGSCRYLLRQWHQDSRLQDGSRAGFGQGIKSSLDYISSSRQSAWSVVGVQTSSFVWKGRGRGYLAIGMGHFQWGLHHRWKAVAIWTPEMVKTDLLALLICL